MRSLAGLLCTFAVALLVPVGVAYAEPVVSTGDETVFEGDSGVVQIAFHFTLSEPSPETLAVLATTFDVTATEGSDYEPVQKFVSFAPGETLSQARSEPVTVEHATADRTATAPSDSQELHGKRPARRR